LLTITEKHRIGVLLERKGIIKNHKKLYRLYIQEKLGVRRRRGRNRARGSRTPMPVALRPGQRPLSVIACNHLPGNGIARLCVRHIWRITQVPYVGRE
jgi:hypothetical protein